MKLVVLTLALIVTAGMPGWAVAPDTPNPQTPPKCEGACDGRDKNDRELSNPCSSYTDAQLENVGDQLCNGANAPTNGGARDDANEKCLSRDDTGNCLCSGGTFSDKKVSWRDVGRIDGRKCKVKCELTYTGGTCKTLTASEPQGVMASLETCATVVPAVRIARPLP